MITSELYNRNKVDYTARLALKSQGLIEPKKDYAYKVIVK
jgi:hypothetical protein